MLRVLGSRGASAGKLSANSDELSRVGEEALSLPEHGWVTRGVPGGAWSHSPSSFRRPRLRVLLPLHVASAMDGAITAN